MDENPNLEHEREAGDERERREEALVNTVYALRGEFLSAINQIESWLNYGVAAYFGHHDDPAFIGGLLAPLSTRRKLDLIEQIARQEGLGDYFKAFLTDFGDANDYRNHLAHSHVSLFLPDSYELMSAAELAASETSAVSVRLTSRGVSTEYTDLLDLRTRLARLWRTQDQAMKFYIAANAISGAGGGTLLEKLTEYDRLFP